MIRTEVQRKRQANPFAPAELTRSQLRHISGLVKGNCGINLHDGKKELIKARLAKRLRQLHLRSFEEYIGYLSNDTNGHELTAMLDALSTNLTSFFREQKHFEYLERHVLPKLLADADKASPRLRIWSAGCSSGEEPYSIAMTVCEGIPNAHPPNARILATDISTGVLARAKKGIYSAKQLKTVPPHLRAKSFQPVGNRADRAYQVSEHLRKMVCFARLNLMNHWPMVGPFDVICCRNVMIYFDRPTREKLIERFANMLAPGGVLFIGHSESLTGARNRLRYVQPAVYEKP